MGTGYTRNDVSNNIADGNIINAADLDGEFDAVESAFNSSTGHTHDGTAAEGGAITVVGPVQDLVVSATEVKPKTTNTLDLGTSGLLYKDAYLQGNMYFRDTALKIVSSADGQLDIDADVEVEIVAPTVDIDASTALTVDTASTTFTSTVFNVTGSANITGDLDIDNININGNTIISTDTNGAINVTPNGTGAVNITATTNITGDLDVDNININGNTIISTDTNGDINLSPNGTGTVVINTDLDVDNININGNTIISTDTNGDINISPDGTGTVVIDTDLDVDNINVNGNTVSSTDTNGNINLSPNGTGTVVINTDLDVDNININGNTIISTDTNGNIALTPNGTGEVDISKVDIASGEIDGTTIGANSAAAGTFTTLSATTLGSAVDLNSQALTNANIDSGAIDGITLGTNSAVTEAQVDNININGNTISSTDTNGNINLVPNGTGEVNLTDNDKLTFGAGSDLQIYHDGSNSYIQDTGTGNLFIQGESAVYIRDNAGAAMAVFNDGGAVQLRYNGSEKLATTATGVNVTGTVTADGLTVEDSLSGSDLVYLNNINPTASDVLRLNTAGNGSGTNILDVQSAGTTHFMVRGDGNVGIGTTSPNRQLTVSNSGAALFSLVSTNDDNCQILFGDSASDTVGKILYNHSSNAMSFETNAAERMRIDSSGNLMVGKTAVGYATDGFEARSGGQVAISDTSQVPLLLNRNTDDGGIINFYKSGGTVGVISSQNSGDLAIGQTYTGLLFNDAANNIIPFDPTNGTSRDTVISLGADSNRFKNLYLSGGVYLGGTGSANHLDDYEEGTWTGTLYDAQSGGTQSSTTSTGYYTKIGRIVFFNFSLVDVSTTGLTSGNEAYFTLPFTASSAFAAPVTNVLLRDVNWGGTQTSISSYLAGGTSRFRLYVQGDNQSYSSIRISEISDGVADFYFTGQYIV